MEVRSLTGRLLVAAPALQDPNFDRTVVLLLDHNGEGALGLVLNRPSTTSLEQALPQWAGRAAEPQVVFVGGPVNPNSAICLGGSKDHDQRAAWKPLFGELGTVDLHADPDEVGVPLAWLRVFVGYASWAPGQLEGEIEAGAWFVLDADESDAGSPEPLLLWHDVLHRQRGPLASLANLPADPSVN